MKEFLVKYESRDALVAAGLTPEQADEMSLPAYGRFFRLPTAAETDARMEEIRRAGSGDWEQFFDQLAREHEGLKSLGAERDEQ
jgi:hypothetical protein